MQVARQEPKSIKKYHKQQQKISLIQLIFEMYEKICPLLKINLLINSNTSYCDSALLVHSSKWKAFSSNFQC